MATHSVAAGKVGTGAFALAASTIDTVTFADTFNRVEVITDGAAAVWYTVNGVTPTVGGADCYYLPATPSVDVRLLGRVSDQEGGTVKLLSTGTPTLRVQRGDRG